MVLLRLCLSIAYALIQVVLAASENGNRTSNFNSLKNDLEPLYDIPTTTVAPSSTPPPRILEDNRCYQPQILTESLLSLANMTRPSVTRYLQYAEVKKCFAVFYVSL